MNLDQVRILYSAEEIQDRINQMGAAISQDYAGEELLVIGILKGAFMFMADLVRKIDVPLQIDFMDVSSYGSSTISSGEVRIMKDLDYSIEGKNVLIVEDIVDTGLTLKYICDMLRQRNPQSLKIACLLDKPSRRQTDTVPDYVGFSIADEFIVGFGLDYAEYYREYPAICILNPSVYEK